MADDAQDMEMHEFHDTYSSVIDMADEFWEDHQDEDNDDGQPSSYDEYQDLYGGDDNPADYMDFESFENWADDVVENGLENAPVEEMHDDPEYKGWLKIYTKNPDAAETHPKHEEFLKYYQSQEKEDNIDIAIDPSGAISKAEEKPQVPVTEFVLSLFDRETGQFPKGETAVLTAVEKDYGEQYINGAKEFIEAIKHKFEEHSMRQEASDEHDAEMTKMRELAGLSI
jgi:hypothetical protein